MIWTVSRRRSPSRRRSMPLAMKRSWRRSALRRSVGAGQWGSGAASAARAASNGKAGRSPGCGGSRRTPSSRPSWTAARKGSSPASQQVVHRHGDEHRLAAAAQAGDREAQSSRSSARSDELLEAALRAGRATAGWRDRRGWSRRTGSPSGPTLPASSARQTRSPSSRLLRKRRRQDVGSSMSRVRICQTKWPPTAISRR